LGELSVCHGRTLAGAIPSVRQLAHSSKPSVALSMEILEP
jgi:hypothetical protein